MLALPGRRTAQAGIEPIIWGAVATAWALALMLAAGGHSSHLGHGLSLGVDIATLGKVLPVLAAWQVMTAGMMLPSSLPLVWLFARASRKQAHPRLVLAVFLAAYFAVWTGFACAALVADSGIRALTSRWAWLDARPELVAGGVLLLAGAFQFSSLKERCLDACRNPMHFMWRFYGRGVSKAWSFGIHHGLFCLGCCWALMLIMFAVGVGQLVVMALLTGLMTIEKTARHGRRLAPIAGVGLLLWGAVILANPGWLPASLGVSDSRHSEHTVQTEQTTPPADPTHEHHHV